MAIEVRQDPFAEHPGLPLIEHTALIGDLQKEKAQEILGTLLIAIQLLLRNGSEVVVNAAFTILSLVHTIGYRDEEIALDTQPEREAYIETIPGLEGRLRRPTVPLKSH